MPLIESGKLDSDEMNTLLNDYMQPMIKANIDYLVLGCTHYPYLIPQLLNILPKQIKIIDSGAAVAKQTQTILEQQNLLNSGFQKPELHFYSNGNPEVMKSLLGENFEVIFLDF